MKRHLVAALAGLLVLTACGAGEAPPESTTTSTSIPALSAPDPVDPAANLAAARALWDERGRASYRYTFTDDCGECDPELKEPFEVAVYKRRLLPGDARGVEIPELFAIIDRAIADGDTVIADYDEQTGVPTEITINPQDFAVDGGSHFLIEDLVLGPPGMPITDEAVEEALARWREHGPSAYEYTVAITCDCPESGTYMVRVTSAGNEISVVAGSGGGDAVALPMDQLLEDLYGLEELAAADLDVALNVLFRVDPSLGHLTWLWVDADVASEVAGFEELEMVATVSNVTPISDEPVIPNSADIEAYIAARALWESRGFSDYAYRLQFNCMCPEEYRGPFDVIVEAGVITQATWLGEPVGDGVGLMTIDQIFDAIARAIDEGVEVAIRYDPETGVPLRADLDLEAIAVDGGLSLGIEDFRLLREG